MVSAFLVLGDGPHSGQKAWILPSNDCGDAVYEREGVSFTAARDAIIKDLLDPNFKFHWVLPLLDLYVSHIITMSELKDNIALLAYTLHKELLACGKRFMIVEGFTCGQVSALFSGFGSEVFAGSIVVRNLNEWLDVFGVSLGDAVCAGALGLVNMVNISLAVIDSGDGVWVHLFEKRANRNHSYKFLVDFGVDSIFDTMLMKQQIAVRDSLRISLSFVRGEL